MCIRDSTYLWFLPALFILFLLFYVIIKANMLSSIVLVEGVFLNFICDNITILILKDVCMYFIWFYTGYLFENYRNRIKDKYIVVGCLLYTS